MKLLVKIAGWAAVGFVVLVAVCVIILKSISNEQYKEWISEVTYHATGRQLTFDGEVNVQFGKQITFLANGIRFGNGEQGTRPDMVTADRFLLRLALLPIFKGALDFAIELDGPDILLETNEDGKGNWVFNGSSLEEEPVPEHDTHGFADSFALPLKPYVRNFEIANLKFAFNDKVTDKQISAAIDTLEIFVNGNEVRLTLTAAYNGAPVELAGILGHIDDLYANRKTPISLEGRLNEANLAIRGSYGPLVPMLNAQADLQLQADTFATFSPFAGIDLPDIQGLDLSLTALATEGKFAAEDINILVNDAALNLNVAGNVGDLSHVAGINLTTEAHLKHLDTILEQLGLASPVGLPASLDYKGVVTGSLEELALDSLNAVVEDDGIAVNINGKVKNLLAPAGVDISLAAAADTIAKISKFTGTEIPDLGTLDLKGRIISKGEQIRLDNMDISLHGEMIDAQVEAVVDDLMALAKIAAHPDNYGAAGVGVSFKADTASISQLAQAGGVDIPDLGSLQLVGKIASTKQSLGLESLETVVRQQGMNTRATAKVADLINLSGINGTADIEIDSLSTLSALIDSNLPQTGPWVLNVTAAAVDVRGATELVANLSSEGLKAVINTTVPDIKDPENLQASVSMDAESLSVIGELLNRKMVNESPISVRAKAVVQPGEYRVDEFQLMMGDAIATADLQYTMPPDEQNKPKLVGLVEINDFDITTIFAANELETDSPAEGVEATNEAGEAEKQGKEENLEATAESRNEAASTGEKKLFSNEPLATGALQNYDLDLKINASNLTLVSDFKVDGSLAVTLDQGVLKLGPLDLKGQSGGAGESLIILDASKPEANFDIRMKFDNFVSPRFGGNIDLDVDLDGHGESIAAVMGTLNGRFIAALNDFMLKQSGLTKFGSGLFSQLNPLKKDTTVLECGIVRFEAQDGMVDFNKKIAAQTTEVTWFGSGEINLKTEELDFEIHPQPRTVLSSLTDVGVAELIHIGGTLAEPSIGIDPKDVVLKYGKYSAYIATGGLSFLAEKVFENRQANMNQCERILIDLKEK